VFAARRAVDAAQARAESLTGAGLAAITARLARTDRSSRRGPWTGVVLSLIAEQPGVVSTVLADEMGWERVAREVAAGPVSDRPIRWARPGRSATARPRAAAAPCTWR
jgi:hypothetical protein